MSDVAIRVENLSKRYKIGALRSRHDTLRDHLVTGLKSLLNSNGKAEKARLATLNGAEVDSIWALRNVSFEVKHGAIIGFIGRNGAGKSTLLKVISRITEPTEGKVTITGRVGSLLEVGTGFHSELTGRENVYLSGAVLGMTRLEIQKKFDQIVDFAEVEKFIDTPVKRYSSGMYVRLAFSVVAHLDPEILIVDEVLAVGDLAFQVKCLNKMHEIRQQGKTILFVSHNMETIGRLCSHVLLLNGGRILKSGSPTDVIPLYLKSFNNLHAEHTWDSGGEPGNDIVRLKNVRVRNPNGNTITVADIRFPIGIEIEYDVLKPGVILIPNFHFCNVEGLQLFVLQDVSSEWRSTPRPIGRYRSVAWIPGNFLAEGSIAVDVAISTHVPKNAIHVFDRRSVGFQVVDSFDGNSARGDYMGQMPGVIRPLMEWNTVVIKPCSESIEREAS